ncbi:hypothetical protein B0T21DRAFT_357725 [Apiosordaria backusii]|uniref:Uncharacterized protein n=1 Tax=Apiosordaria backusii TaxID=314023 RepID=A0AA40K3A9_9PEZI|nr:hypothetical protein B0T21DRAFT_357725 [Apiosordaria backusii]
MAVAQRDVFLYRRPISNLANIPVLNKWSKSEFNHWTVCVGDICYEVVRTPGDPKLSHNLRILTKSEWIEDMQEKKLDYKHTDLGVCKTTWPDNMIAECADNIWDVLFEKTFQNFLWNCQEFALWLLRCIVDSLSEKEISERWESYNPDVLIPALLMGLGPGVAAGATAGAAGAAAGAVTVDLAVSWGVITLAVGAAAVTSYEVKKYKRHKKGKELVDKWHTRMNTRPKSSWRRLLDTLF